MSRTLMLLALALGACTAATPSNGPEPSTPAVSPQMKSRPPRSAPTTKGARRARAWSLRWTRQGSPLARGLLVAGDGVFVWSGRRLRKWSLAEGKLQAEAKSCFSFAGALHAVDAERVALVCEREILFYASQDLAFLGKKELPGVAVAAASQPGCTATLMADKRIVLHTGPSLAATQEGGLKQTALALSVAPDCKTVGLIHADASVSIFDAGTQQSKTIWRRPGLVPQQLAFGPRGERLLIVTEATVMLLGLRGARKVRSLSATSGGAWAQWLGPTSVALAGRDGLLALEVHAEKSRSLSDRPQGLRLAANRDGDPGWLCMTWLDGQLGCFGEGASAAAASPTMAALVPQTRRASYARSAGLQGRMLRVRLYNDASNPRTKQRFAIARYMEQRVRDRVDVRWEPMGEATVVRITDNEVLLRLDRTVDPQVQRARDLPYDNPLRLVPAPAVQ